MRSRQWVTRPDPQPRIFYRACELTEAHYGHLVTVTASPATRSRGHLMVVRSWGADDLTGEPGDVVLVLRARRGHRTTSGPEWKLVVPSDAPVLVHTHTDHTHTKEMTHE